MAELVFNIDSTALETIQSLSIKANFEEMKAALAEVVEPYKSVLVTEETVPVAKADLAKLRKVVKAIEDRRKLFKKMYTEPLTAFEDKCKELVAVCNQGINNLDDQVKGYETRAKQKKMLMLTEYFDAHNTVPEYLAIEDVANPKWVNITYDVETIHMEIDNAIARTATDVDAIKAFGSRHESMLLDEYKKTHDITAVLGLKKRIEDSEREAAAKEERRKQEEAKRMEAAQRQAEPKVEIPKEPEVKPVSERKPISELYQGELVNCPYCGSTEYHTVYIRESNDEVVGCSDCIVVMDGYDFTQAVIDQAYDAYVNSKVDEQRGK